MSLYQEKFDSALEKFLQAPVYGAAKDAVFTLTRAAFLAGWLAAGGASPQEERIFQVLPGGAAEQKD